MARGMPLGALLLPVLFLASAALTDGQHEESPFVVGVIAPFDVLDPTHSHVPYDVAFGTYLAMEVLAHNRTLSGGLPLASLVNGSGLYKQDMIFTTLSQIEDDGVGAIIAATSSEFTAMGCHVCNELEVPLVSAATGEFLSDTEKYSFLTRMAPEETREGAVIAAILEHFSWLKIATIKDIRQRSLAIESAFLTRLNGSVDVMASETFTLKAADQVDDVITRVRNSGVNVFVLLVDDDVASVTLNAANEAGLVGDGFVWIGAADWVHQDFFLLNAHLDLRGCFGIYPYMDTSSHPYAAMSALWETTESVQWKERASSSVTISAAYAYDAVFVIAAALKSVAGETAERDGLTLLNAIREVSFEGVTGNISFSQDGERVGSYGIMNFNGSSLTRVGHYHYFSYDDCLSGTDQSCGILDIVDESLTWAGGATSPPFAGPVLCPDEQYYNEEKKACMEGYPRPSRVYIALLFRLFRDNGSGEFEMNEAVLEIYEAVIEYMRYHNNLGILDFEMIPVPYFHGSRSAKEIAREIVDLNFEDLSPANSYYYAAANVDDDRYRIAAILGPGLTSTVTEMYPTLFEYQTPCVSYGSTSPALTSGTQYLFRTVPADDMLSRAVARLVSDLGFFRVGVVYDHKASYISAFYDALRFSLYDEGVYVLGSPVYLSDDVGFDDAVCENTGFWKMKQDGREIIIVMMWLLREAMELLARCDMLPRTIIYPIDMPSSWDRSLSELTGLISSVHSPTFASDAQEFLDTYNARPRYPSFLPSSSSLTTPDINTTPPGETTPLFPTSEEASGETSVSPGETTYDTLAQCRNETNSVGEYLWQVDHDYDPSTAPYCLGTAGLVEQDFKWYYAKYAVDAYLAIASALNSSISVDGRLYRTDIQRKLSSLTVDGITGTLHLAKGTGDREGGRYTLTNHDGVNSTMREIAVWEDDSFQALCDFDAPGCIMYATGEKPSPGCINITQYIFTQTYTCAPCGEGLLALESDMTRCTSCGRVQCEEDGTPVSALEIVIPVVVVLVLFVWGHSVVHKAETPVVFRTILASCAVDVAGGLGELVDVVTDTAVFVMVLHTPELGDYIIPYSVCVPVCWIVFLLCVRARAINRREETSRGDNDAKLPNIKTWDEFLTQVSESSRLAFFSACFEDFVMVFLNMFALYNSEVGVRSTEARIFLVSSILNMVMFGRRLGVASTIRTVSNMAKSLTMPS
eukprot:Rmarinus@m.808